MNKERMAELFDNSEEFLMFDNVKVNLSNRPDLHAFLLLDQLTPGTSDMVSAAEHDEIWLSINEDTLAEVITEEQVLDLVRCGVRYVKYQGLCMFA